MPKIRFTSSTVLAPEYTGLDAPLNVRIGSEHELSRSAIEKLSKILAPTSFEILEDEKPGRAKKTEKE